MLTLSHFGKHPPLSLFCLFHNCIKPIKKEKIKDNKKYILVSKK